MNENTIREGKTVVKLAKLTATLPAIFDRMKKKLQVKSGEYLILSVFAKLSFGFRFLLLKVTHHSIDGHVENSPGPHNIEQAVDVLEDGDHHLIFIFGSRSVDSRVHNVKGA